MFVEAAIMGPMFKLLLGRLPTLHRSSTCHVIIYELAKAREKWPQLRQHLWCLLVLELFLYWVSIATIVISVIILFSLVRSSCHTFHVSLLNFMLRSPPSI